MIIHHYVPFTSNVGDLFVRDGIHLRLHEQFRGATIIELPANDPHRRSRESVGLIGSNLARSNAEADLVIVGGSNMYEGPEWRFITSVDAIQALRPPLVFSVWVSVRCAVNAKGHCRRNPGPKSVFHMNEHWAWRFVTQTRWNFCMVLGFHAG